MTERIYIESAGTDLNLRANRIQAIIDALYLQSLTAASSSDISEYSLNDGQTTISTTYRDPESIARAITAFERLLQSTLNKLNGCNMVLRNSRGLR